MESTSIDPRNPEGLRALHAVAAEAGAADVEIDVLLSCAATALRAQMYDDVMSILHAALVIDPDSAQAWSLCGIVFERRNRDDDARVAYETALGLNEEDLVTAMALAQIYVRQEMLSRAQALLTWLVEESEDAPLIRARAVALARRVTGVQS